MNQQLFVKQSVKPSIDPYRYRYVTLESLSGSNGPNRVTASSSSFTSDSFRLGKIILPLLMFSALLYLVPYIRIDKSNSFDPNGLTSEQLVSLRSGRMSSSTDSELRASEVCTSPRGNVFFLKTHKCASSAVQRIFLKYGYSHHKIFALPPTGNYLGHPEPFDRSLLSPAFYGQYNIFAIHTRFSLSEISAVMPSDTMYITILRHPEALYESMFGYWNLTKFYNLPRNFLDAPAIPLDRLKSLRWINKIGANQMLFDLGYDALTLDDKRLTSLLSRLEQIFDLVMIAERFDESLILLKEKLCWSFDDIITFKINARPQRKKLTPLAEERIKQINWADVQLYDHFASIFQAKVEGFGVDRMSEAVKYLRSREAQWYSECVYNETITWGQSTSSVVRLINRQPSNLTCVLLTASELEVINFIRRKQTKFHHGSVKRW